MSQDRVGLAEHYLEEFRSRGRATSTTALLWSVTLLLIWLGGLEPTYREVKTLTTLQTIRESLAKTPAPNVKSIKDLTKKVASQKEDTKVAFKVPGFEFEVPSRYAPLVWAVLALLFALYLSHTRILLLNTCAMALRIHHHELNLPGAAVADFFPRSPFWLTPLPHDSGHRVSPPQFREALGWERTETRNFIFLVVSALLFVGLNLRVAWIGYVVSDALAQDLDAWLLPKITGVTVFASLFVVLNWIAMPLRVPDNFAPEKNLNAVGRRDIFRYAALALVAGTFSSLSLFFRVHPQLQRQPRFVRHRRFPSSVSGVPPGFHLNPRSQVIHYASSEGRLLDVSSIRVDLLQPVATTAIPGTPSFDGQRVHLSAASRFLEDAALSLIKKGQYDEGCKLLVTAIEHNLLFMKRAGGPPSYRLYDLLAGVAVRFELPIYLDKVIQLAKREGANDALKSRARRWSDSNSAWRRRWSDRTKGISWVGLPM